MNKYKREPEAVIDLHGNTTAEAKVILNGIISQKKYQHIRIITGKASFRESGPVLRTFVENYLKEKEIDFDYAKLYDGGQGALEVYFNK